MPPRGVTSFGIRDQRTTPQGRGAPAQPTVRALSGGNSGIGDSLTAAARSVRAVQQAEAQVDDNEAQLEALRLRQDEEDGRAEASRAVARFRAESATMRRQAFEQAADGWRGATETVATNIGKLREALAESAPSSPLAQRFIRDAIGAVEPAFLEDVAEEQNRRRQSWRIDTAREAVRVESSAIAADPRLYDQAVAQQRELISGMTDIDADARRDLLSAMEEELAVTTVGALIDRNPGNTLARLRDPEADGPFAQLSGRQRTQFINQAQAEINRRRSEYEASLRTRIAATTQLLEMGEQPPPDAPSVEQVRTAFGDGAAAAYAIRLEAGNAASEMNQMPSAELAQIAASPPSQGTEGERYTNAARRAAAAQILERRQTDPMADYARAGNIDTAGMVEAIQQGNFAQIGQRLQARTGIAQQNAATLGTRPAPLTNGEAAALRGTLDRMTPQQRTAALQAMGIGGGQGVTASARAALNQIYASDPASRMGAFLMGRAGSVTGANGRVGGETAGRRMLHGAALLNPPETGESERQERAQIEMPGDAAMRAVWADVVGDAYAGNPELAEQAYGAYRAYFAGALAETGMNGADLRTNGSPREITRLAEEAARVAAGDIHNNRDGSRTILPWGVSDQTFTQGLRTGWAAIQQAYPNSDISRRSSADFDYQFEASDGRHAYYRVMDRGAQATGAEGQAIVIRVPVAAR